ncbi:MAG: hypothetical protein SH818_01750 [Saprospiraceae bacterium]|nr:hypothetical protein [Saprospiraceae bacterium]
MKSLSFDKMASIEGGDTCTGYTGTYCPLAFLVLGAALKTHSLFAFFAGIALKKALCTPCGVDTTT